MADFESTADIDLLRLAATGDADAYATFFRRHERAIAAYAAKRCAVRADVPDLVSDVFLAALQRADRYRAETTDARPWLYGIAERLIANNRRRAVRRSRALVRAMNLAPTTAPPETDLVDAAIDASSRYRSVRDAIAALPLRERQALYLVALAGLTPSEAASALGVTPNAVRIRLSRARAALAGVEADECLTVPLTNTEAAHA